MNPIDTTFVLIIIPMSVVSENIWYPVKITEENIPAFVLASKYYASNKTSDFEAENTTVNIDHNIFRYNLDIDHKRRLTFPKQTATPEKLITTHNIGNISMETENIALKKDMGGKALMLPSFNLSISNRNDLSFPGTLGRVMKKKIVKNRLSRANETTNSHTAKSRFLDVFQIVEFEQVLCSSTTGLDGRCLHDYDCQTAGGTPMGTCADGYGICCVITFSCHDHTSELIGWFTNPEYPLPNTDRLSCALILNKTSSDVKQIRLDFAKFELLPPTGGICEDDQFVVSGQNINSVIPILCGINSGQHIYIEVGDTEGPIRLTIQTVAAENRLFSIKVSQLTRSDILTAPAGCLQYFNGPHGYIESFNYRNISEVTTASRPSYLNNLNYAICIEREVASCSITYINEDEMQIVNYDTDGLPIIPPRQAGVEIFNCPSDWLLVSAVRLCGDRLNDGSILQDFYLDAPVTDIGAGPITVWFRSDESYVGRGFKLQYQQNLCTILK